MIHTNKSIIIFIFLLTPSITWPAALPTIAPNAQAMPPNFDKSLQRIIDYQHFRFEQSDQLKNETVGLQIVTNLKYLKQQTFDTESQSTERSNLPNESQPAGLTDLPSEILQHISKYVSLPYNRYDKFFRKHCGLTALAPLRLSCRALRAQSHTVWHAEIMQHWGAKIIFKEIQYGHATTIKELLDLGANARGACEKKPLLWRACLLLDFPIDTPLKFNLLTIVTDLLNAGANPNDTDLETNSNSIVQAPYEACVLLLSLSQHTVDINAQSKRGSTALTNAVIGNKRSKVQLLLLHKADHKIEHMERTPMEWAKHLNYSEIAEDLHHFALTGLIRDMSLKNQ